MDQINLPEIFNLTLNSSGDLHRLLGHLKTLHFTHTLCVPYDSQLPLFNGINLLVFFTVGNFVVCVLRNLVAYIIYHRLISLSRWFISLKSVPLKPSGCFQYQRS